MFRQFTLYRKLFRQEKDIKIAEGQYKNSSEGVYQDTLYAIQRQLRQAYCASNITQLKKNLLEDVNAATNSESSLLWLKRRNTTNWSMSIGGGRAGMRSAGESQLGKSLLPRGQSFGPGIFFGPNH